MRRREFIRDWGLKPTPQIDVLKLLTVEFKLKLIANVNMPKDNKIILFSGDRLDGVLTSSKSGSSPIAKTGAADDSEKGSGPTGPVEDLSQLQFNEGFLSRPEQIISGAWVSQCYSLRIHPHIPFVSHFQFYRMFYIFDAAHGIVQHTVREYQDPLCEDNFAAAFDPNTNETIVIKGFYQVTKIDPTFPQIMRISLNWTACSGASCQRPQNPVDQTYLFQNKLVVFRQSSDGRQVLFWGNNVPPHMGSNTPFLPEQWFQWDVAFFRLPH